MSHTPEPWQVLTGKNAHPSSVEISADGRAIAEMWLRGETIAQDNARRIVACVNACAGIDIDFLERIPLTAVTAQLKKLTEQRDVAWAEQSEIRKAIQANPEESTEDEVRRVVYQRDILQQQRDTLLAALEMIANEAYLQPEWERYAKDRIASIESPTHEQAA